MTWTIVIFLFRGRGKCEFSGFGKMGDPIWVNGNTLIGPSRILLPIEPFTFPHSIKSNENNIKGRKGEKVRLVNRGLFRSVPIRGCLKPRWIVSLMVRAYTGSTRPGEF